MNGGRTTAHAMTWTALIVILVIVIAGSKLARHSLTVLAAMASILALVWLLAAPDRPRDPEQRGSGSHASLTSRTVLPSPDPK
jgi:hypothetical protein